MQDNATFPVSSDLNTTAKVGLTHAADLEKSEEWWDAQQRMLFYLQALKVPAESSLRIALEALGRAMDDSHRIKEANSTSLAMKELRQILTEEDLACFTRTNCSPGDSRKSRHRDALSSAACTFPDTLDDAETISVTNGDLSTMPPLNRSSMRAETIERSLMHSLVHKLLTKFKNNHY